MFAWVLRALVVNEYTTGKYGEVQQNGLTLGENILIRFGFFDEADNAFTSEWIWYVSNSRLDLKIPFRVLTLRALQVWTRLHDCGKPVFHFSLDLFSRKMEV